MRYGNGITLACDDKDVTKIWLTDAGPEEELFTDAIVAVATTDPDGVKALLGDAQGAGPVAITSPDGERATRLDLFDKSLRQELGHDFAGGAPGQICRPFKGTVVALRGRRQQH